MAEEGLRSDCTPPVLLESGASYSHEETSKFNLAEDVKVFLGKLLLKFLLLLIFIACKEIEKLLGPENESDFSGREM